MSAEKAMHRLGGPGGPTCPVGVLSVFGKNERGELVPTCLLDAGLNSSELELLRTVASRMGVQWGHDDLGWWAAVPGRDFPSWAVWRQDDSGNRFLVEANLTAAKASAMVEEFTAKGHKQVYWCTQEMQDAPAQA